jgi:hypothetical protein
MTEYQGQLLPPPMPEIADYGILKKKNAFFQESDKHVKYGNEYVQLKI